MTFFPANSGINFYFGNNADYQKTIGIRPGPEYDKIAFGPDTRSRSGRTLNSYFYGSALSFITTHPKEWLGCVVYKIRTLVNGYELPETEDLYSFRDNNPIFSMLIWKAGWLGFPFRDTASAGVSRTVVPQAGGENRLGSLALLLNHVNFAARLLEQFEIPHVNNSDTAYLCCTGCRDFSRHPVQHNSSIGIIDMRYLELFQ